MGLFETLFAKKPALTNSEQINKQYWQTLTAYAPTFTTREGCSYEQLLVRSAIDARARHMSKLAIEMIGNSHPELRAKLTKAPNSFMTTSQFLYRLSTILDMQNTAFILPVFEQCGKLAGYFPVLPSKCELIDVNNTPFLRYTFSNGKRGAVELSAVGILTKFQYKSDFFGTPNTALNQTLDLIDLQTKAIAEAVKSSASYKFIAQLNNFAKAEDLVRERNNFDTNNFANENKNGGGVLLFPNSWQNIKQLEPKNYVVDAAQAKQIETNVYNYFGVNASILQNSAKSEELDAFFNGAIEPFAIQLSEVLTKMTFSEKEQSFGNRILVTANKLQYMSVANKISIAQQLGDRGMITINEIRELFNYPALEEGGDIKPIRGEYYLLGSDGKITTKDNNGGNKNEPAI